MCLTCSDATDLIFDGLLHCYCCSAFRPTLEVERLAGRAMRMTERLLLRLGGSGGTAGVEEIGSIFSPGG